MSSQQDREREMQIEQLVELEKNPDLNPGSTLSHLKGELDTIANDLSGSPEPCPHTAESACGAAVDHARKLVADQTRSGHKNKEVHLPEDKRIGQYELRKKLGQGGMGAVYEGWHSLLEKRVAVKLLTACRMTSPAAVNRFLREMKAVGRIDHPHLVSALDAGHTDDSSFLVMEYIDGQDLSDVIQQHGPLPIEVACELVCQAARGMRVAHDQGLIHRDLKPANLMLARQQYGPPLVKVLDLGLALLVEDASDSPEELTMAGQLMGTLDYMPPEQAGDSHLVDARCDVYSLGATLYTLLAGHSPYNHLPNNSVMLKLQRMATEPVPSIRESRPDLPAALVSVLEKAMARDCIQRTASMEELLNDLTPFAADARMEWLLGDHAVETQTEDATVIIGTAIPTEEPTPGSQLAKNSADTERTAKTEPVSSRSGRSPWLWAVALLLPLLITGVLFGGTVFQFVTDQGVLTIQVDDPNVEVKIIQNGLVVVDQTDQREFTLAAKNGEVLVTEKGGLHLLTKQFELRRGGKSAVKITIGELQAARTQQQPQPANPPGKNNPQSDQVRAVEQFLAMGAVVHVQGGEGRIESLDQLPEGPIRIHQLSLTQLKLTAEDMTAFEQCEHLEHLYFSHCMLPLGDALKSFAHCNNLVDLGFYICNIDDAGLAHFKNATGLTALSLRGLPNMTLEGVKTFQTCKLKSLILAAGRDENNVTDRTVELFHQTAANLESLSISSPNVTDAGLTGFSDSTKLNQLILEHMPVTDAGLAIFQNCTELGSLSLYGLNITDKGLTHFKNSDQIHRLTLGRLALTDDGLQRFAEFPLLGFVTWYHLPITSQSLKHLENRTLSTLNLSHTNVGDDCINFLKSQNSLTLLNLTATQVTAEGAAALREALPKCKIQWSPPEEP